MSDTIYLVCGDVGHYSDHQEWIVAWYPTRAEADAHVAALVAKNEADKPLLEACDWDYDKIEAIVKTPLDEARSTYCGDLPSYSVAVIERGKWPFDLPPRGEVTP